MDKLLNSGSDEPVGVYSGVEKSNEFIPGPGDGEAEKLSDAHSDAEWRIFANSDPLMLPVAHRRGKTLLKIVNNQELPRQTKRQNTAG